MPPRIAFEPTGDAKAPGRRGLEAALHGAREAWSQGRPAVISTHRMNYAHLDPAWSQAGRAALSALLERLCADGAVFLTDHEVRQLSERAWSVRELAGRGVLLRHYGVPRESLRFPAPEGVRRTRLVGPHDDPKAEVGVEQGEVEARVNLGEYVLEWTDA